MNIKTKDVKVGDVLSLDWGYGAHADDRPSEVLAIHVGPSLFHKPGDAELISFDVKVLGLGIHTTHQFDPESTVTMEPGIKDPKIDRFAVLEVGGRIQNTSTLQTREVVGIELAVVNGAPAKRYVTRNLDTITRLNIASVNRIVSEQTLRRSWRVLNINSKNE